MVLHSIWKGFEYSNDVDKKRLLNHKINDSESAKACSHPIAGKYPTNQLKQHLKKHHPMQHTEVHVYTTAWEGTGADQIRQGKKKAL